MLVGRAGWLLPSTAHSPTWHLSARRRAPGSWPSVGRAEVGRATGARRKVTFSRRGEARTWRSTPTANLWPTGTRERPRKPSLVCSARRGEEQHPGTSRTSFSPPATTPPASQSSLRRVAYIRLFVCASRICATFLWRARPAARRPDSRFARAHQVDFAPVRHLAARRHVKVTFRPHPVLAD